MNTRKLAFCLWLLLIIMGITTYLFFPEKIYLPFIRDLAEEYYLALGVYFLLLSFRGLTMIPSTPLLFAGILLFDPVQLFIVNMAGIMISSTIIYYFSRYLGFAAYFEANYGKYVKKIKLGLEDKELPIIIGWSFFPLVPTDLVVHIGSVLEIHIFKCLLGVFVGEALLNALYIFSANMILHP